MQTPKYEVLPIADLRPYEGNPRKHPARQIRKIEKSLRRFGFLNPIMINAENQILAGHGRLDAARQIGCAEVPVVRVDHLSEDEQRAYRLADNRLAEDGAWDDGLLRIEIDALLKIDFDPDLTGFEAGEIDVLMDADAAETPVPGLPPKELIVTRPNDLWQLGPHRIICGDCRDEQLMQRLMKGVQARLVVTDAPYNCIINGHVSGTGKHAEFAMASGEMTNSEFVSFLEASIGAMARTCVDGALVYAFMDWRNLYSLQTACQRLGSLHRQHRGVEQGQWWPWILLSIGARAGPGREEGGRFTHQQRAAW
jgi:hypothetical protein